jgi:hypothetical protein
MFAGGAPQGFQQQAGLQAMGLRIPLAIKYVLTLPI